ncbi:MAG: lipoprotein [Coxiellaceae bacterium]|nr:lipoprotein [Coxiellaceae bacterium]
MKYRIITLLLICMVITACGQYGALYLPGQKKSKTLKKNSVPAVATAVEGGQS